MSKINPKEHLGKSFREFDEKDPFNGNRVTGFISRTSDDRYGALMITAVNGKECVQLIKCTPKLHYPFDGHGRYTFPKARRIERYHKLDGTNIFGYRYVDAKGFRYVSFKTRLLPFVGDSRFGSFQTMLREMLDKYPMIPDMIVENDADISFELWGARNPHLVKYKIPLELSILFGRHSGYVIPPSELKIPTGYVFAGFEGLVDGNYVETYKAAQYVMEKGLVEDDGYYVGQEGEVWYLLTEDGMWHMFKCKPETIEMIHWSQGGIGKNIIMATCENALENWDTPTVTNVKELLLEEFQQHDIDQVHYRIQGYLDEVIERHMLMDTVMKSYKALEMNILTDKREVMRKLSEQYDRRQMRKVYRIIMDHI